MAESNSPRLGLHRYSAGTDTFSRLEWESTMAALEAGAAKFSAGTSRPSFDSTHTGELNYDTDDHVLSYGLPGAWLRIDVPAGVYLPWAGQSSAAVPQGYYLCDGQILSQAAEPRLFAAIGTTYNTGGETAGQFRVPDMLGMMPVGQDLRQTEFYTIGETGGQKTAQLVQHSHGGTTGGQSADHSHGMSHDHDGATAGFWHPTGDSPLRTSASTGAPLDNTLGYVPFTAAAVGIDTAPFNGSTGGASAGHNHTIPQEGVASPSNMPPYRVARWIIKA